MTEQKNINTCLNCGVGNDVHGTCCGFFNAGTIVNDIGIIIDPRHPYHNQSFQEWVNKSTYSVLVTPENTIYTQKTFSNI